MTAWLAARPAAWVLAVCFLRGLGFALTVVAGGALTASLIPAERRGEGLALMGIMSGVPSLLGLPLGVWPASEVGYAPVAVAAVGGCHPLVLGWARTEQRSVGACRREVIRLVIGVTPQRLGRRPAE
ncbi:hypothetical protein [Streptomyces sp. ISL-94]|uniref:hypothetical protein n=1 Tax=Streptomyces sp. ISL-94 TaxID=2819190 RepID=UPI0020354817|nr:hypothetical protein [Streptomyces sp. ISL-94]